MNRLILNLSKQNALMNPEAAKAVQSALGMGIGGIEIVRSDAEESHLLTLLSSSPSPPSPLPIYLKIGYTSTGSNMLHSPEFISHEINTSPIVKSGREVIPVIHNLEEGKRDRDLKEFEEVVKICVGSFDEITKKTKNTPSYGLSSNGLGLSISHPLHLSLETFLNHSTSSFTHLFFPYNPIETTSISQIPKDKSFKTIAFRPLTGYPDGGVGEGVGLRFLDYDIRGGMTMDMKGVGEEYNSALKLALGHFDAEYLTIESGERTLTPEERETLDGCKLLRSLILSEDRSLDSIRSFQSYEKNLTQNIIPLIHENFEELDEESTEVLAGFFMEHANAVRWYSARETRRLMRVGGDDGMQREHYVEENESLQSYAVRFCLEEVDCVSVGVTRGTYLKEFEEIFKKV
ncbi:hypothetical protein TrLO_g14008 [Triparma laevis f. longispina]|uniref:Uncharacterized protein n=1 Tax=Triparma laevis f. longispina TaxID=1714387 RepID=A0A9W7DQF1_9STRA|nr:hypothetical protein TrLO_g14008 [Triparma laevis f. longispina]